MFSELISGIKSKLEERKRAKLGDYFGMVRRAAAGEQMAPDKALTALDHFGKTPEQFEADVKLLVQRDEWRKKLEALPALKARQAEIPGLIDRALSVLRAEQSAAMRKYEAVAVPLEFELRKVEAGIVAAAEAERQLITTVSGPRAEELLAKQREVNELRRQVAHRLNGTDIRAPKSSLTPEVVLAMANEDRPGHGTPSDLILELANRVPAALAEGERRREELQKQEAEYVRQLAEIRRQMLEV